MITALNEQFLKDVIAGLSKPQKQLSSKYFYDDEGDKLFQQIMLMPEYYLPACELEILQLQTQSIAESFGYNTFDIVELGAGDGTKTVHFLKKLTDLGKKIVYYPLDISADVLATNQQQILEHIPGLEMYPIVGDYFETLGYLKHDNPKILLFMGSNIGNYENEKAVAFLKLLYDKMNPNDLLMLGVDLKKNPKTILNAYDDKQGITKAFNLNLLRRMNVELDANFDIDEFDHYPYYEPITGIAYSYIFSKKSQDVHIDGHKISFEENEMIHTEVSQKYSLKQLDDIQRVLNFSSVQHFLDNRQYYAVSVFKK
jgi:L-histidine N-alpha-methyltransferase